MKYITGKYALNIPSSLHMSTDWHTGDFDWDHIQFKESEESIFGEFGIEKFKKFYAYSGTYAVANQLRAILDLLETGKTEYLRGMRRDFFDTDEYNQLFFSKVVLLKKNENWKRINELMKNEFYKKWTDFLRENDERNHNKKMEEK